MPKLKIEVFEAGTPSATVTIPGWLVASASKLIPILAAKQLKEHDIDFDRIVEIMKDPQANGVILEVEDHKKNERVVISIAADDEGKSGS